MAVTLEPGNKYIIEVSDTGCITPIEKIESQFIPPLENGSKYILEECFRSYLSILYQLSLSDTTNSYYFDNCKDFIIGLCEFYNIDTALINDI